MVPQNPEMVTGHSLNTAEPGRLPHEERLHAAESALLSGDGHEIAEERPLIADRLLYGLLGVVFARSSTVGGG